MNVLYNDGLQPSKRRVLWALGIYFKYIPPPKKNERVPWKGTSLKGNHQFFGWYSLVFRGSKHGNYPSPHMAIFRHSMALFRPSPRIALGEVDGEVRHVSVEPQTGKIRGVCQKDGRFVESFLCLGWDHEVEYDLFRILRNHAVKSLRWIYAEITFEVTRGSRFLLLYVMVLLTRSLVVMCFMSWKR